MVLLRPLPIRSVLRLIRLSLLLLAVPFSQHGVCKVSPFEYRVAIYLLPKEYKNYGYNPSGHTDTQWLFDRLLRIFMFHKNRNISRTAWPKTLKFGQEADYYVIQTTVGWLGINRIGSGDSIAQSSLFSKQQSTTKFHQVQQKFGQQFPPFQVRGFAEMAFTQAVMHQGYWAYTKLVALTLNACCALWCLCCCCCFSPQIHHNK